MKKSALFSLLLLVSAVMSAQGGKTYHVTSQTLNFREAPSTSAGAIQKLNRYDNVIVLNDSINADWYKIKVNDKEGYVSKKYLNEGKAVVSYYQVRTGAVCKDGTSSTATGRGACSHHGGVAYWKTEKKKSVRIVYD